MPSPLAQNRDQVIARQALITTQTNSQFQQVRQVSQSVAANNRLLEDRLITTHKQDRVLQQSLQAKDAKLQQLSDARVATNDSQASKVVATQKDLETYLVAQTQNKFLHLPMALGYA